MRSENGRERRENRIKFFLCNEREWESKERIIIKRRNRKQLNKLHKRNLDLDTFVGFISFRFNAFNVGSTLVSSSVALEYSKKKSTVLRCIGCWLKLNSCLELTAQFLRLYLTYLSLVESRDSSRVRLRVVLQTSKHKVGSRQPVFLCAALLSSYSLWDFNSTLAELNVALSCSESNDDDGHSMIADCEAYRRLC